MSYVRIQLEENVELPSFPDCIDHTDLEWQSKDIEPQLSGPYKITSDGTVEKLTTLTKKPGENTTVSEYTPEYDGEEYRKYSIGTRKSHFIRDFGRILLKLKQ